MNVTVIGTGYVGLVTGACFSEFGLQVTCVDKEAEKISALSRGEIPIYEPGLEDLVAKNTSRGRLSFTTDVPGAIRAADVVFIAVGTPAAEDGSTDLRYVEAVAREIGRCLESYTVVVTKSTVPVGTSVQVRQWIEEESESAGARTEFSVASNPEFLREGAAIGDFMRPDRVVLGVEDGDERALSVLRDLYRPLFLNETPFVVTNIPSSELAKYAANSFLATKISFINEVALVCERIGGDVQAVARAMGLDRRIGSKFLHAGPGYGGSCFPKDTLSAAHFARSVGHEFELVEASIRVNQRQRALMVDKIASVFDGDVSGRRIAVLGLAFKPETDDIRDAPSLDIIRGLQARGASVRAYDPVAMAEASRVLPDVAMCKGSFEACTDADCVVIVTEWNEFRALDLARIKTLLREPIVIDLRNIYEPTLMREAGFLYLSVGR